MNLYILQLKEYLSAHTPDYGDDGIGSLLEMLYAFYTEANPIDNDTIRTHFLSLEPYFKGLPSRDQNSIFEILCAVYAEQERLAFFEGFHVGVRLISELSEG